MKKTKKSKAIRRRLEQLKALRPRTAGGLRKFIHAVLGLRVPSKPMLPGHDAPLAYLEHAFFERPGDALVWANRGGGKTTLGAVATLLDMLFKPGIQVRILGGSLEQSSRMYGYLRDMLERPTLRWMLAGEPTQRRIELINGSAVEALAQSHRSVRGVRVHKLRCDEVEEFDREVWQAAQLVTRSGRCGEVEVRGSVEGLSTAHRAFGLMHELCEQAKAWNAGTVGNIQADRGTVAEAEAGVDHGGQCPPYGRRLFRWSALDVIERCPEERACAGCGLEEDCQGRAKRAEGFVGVDDLIAQKRRVSLETWRAEMLCLRPRREALVYARFDTSRHVRVLAMDAIAAGAGASAGRRGPMVVGGLDFGMRSPMVFLWALVTPGGTGDPRDDMIHVFAEHAATDLVLEEHLRLVAARGLPKPAWVGVDPAGGSRNSQTGVSDIDVLRRAGHRERSVRRRVHEGVEAVRRRLDHGTLAIDPGCATLIRSLSQYHFDVERPDNPDPVKDGPDHAADALRYMVVSHEAGSRPAEMTRYW